MNKVEIELDNAVGFNNNPFVAAVGTESDMRGIIACRTEQSLQ